MKYQTLSLFIVASMALAQLRAAESAPMSTPTPGDSLDRRTLIGDEMNYSSHVDNSRGKKVYRIDHNGDDSSIRKGLIYDFIERRSLLGDLLGGGDRMNIENVNDNSQHRQTMNSHGNKHTTIKKIHKKTRGRRHRRNDEDRSAEGISAKEFFDRRDLGDKDVEIKPATLERRSLLGDLLGSDSTRIENVNDNSLHREATKSHGNSHTSITKIHSENEDNDVMDPFEFFERRDLQEESQESTALNRRGLLWGGDSTTISNVNDNSKTTKTYKSHHNKDTHISKAKYIKRSETEKEVDKDLERRGLLFGGDSMVISNQNDNSKTTKTYNSHGNKYKKITTIKDKSRRRHRRDDDDEDEDDEDEDDESWFMKRDDGEKDGAKELYDQEGAAANAVDAKEKRATTTTTTTILQFDDDKTSENKVDDLGRRNLVSIQVVTQNINGQNIDNNVSSVTKGSSKAKAPSGPHRRPKTKSNSSTSTPSGKKHSKIRKNIKSNGSKKNRKTNISKKSKKNNKSKSKKNSKTKNKH
ncbi:hypothetical protein BGZ68_006886 [Mortierella alpina]|nr:hypothetical protein BGZ68_006886 [Mortierella alpina]